LAAFEVITEAQAVNRAGKLVGDFHFATSEGAVHVLNVPSPAATASRVIGREIVSMARERLGFSQPTEVPSVPDSASR
jgi:L-2-hydroxyglutarate oxidase LhgO